MSVLTLHINRSLCSLSATNFTTTGRTTSAGVVIYDKEVEEDITDSEVTFNTPSRRSGITVKLNGTFGFRSSMTTSLRHDQYGSETNRIIFCQVIIRHLVHVPVGLVIVRQQSVYISGIHS